VDGGSGWRMRESEGKIGWGRWENLGIWDESGHSLRGMVCVKQHIRREG
jgi:hypothetical protein